MQGVPFVQPWCRKHFIILITLRTLKFVTPLSVGVSHPGFWGTSVKHGRHCAACSDAQNTGQASKVSGGKKRLYNEKSPARGWSKAEEKRQKLIKDKHQIQENEKGKDSKWNERQANKIERGSRSHCAAAVESNTAEQEQRKWKAEWETGKCWIKGSDEKRRGLWKRAGECVALFNDGAAF